MKTKKGPPRKEPLIKYLKIVFWLLKAIMWHNLCILSKASQIIPRTKRFRWSQERRSFLKTGLQSMILVLIFHKLLFKLTSRCEKEIWKKLKINKWRLTEKNKKVPSIILTKRNLLSKEIKTKKSPDRKID